MMAFLLFATAVIGMTNILVDSKIAAPLRDWLKTVLHPKAYEVFECHQCMGTWCGLLCGVILMYAPPLYVLLYACAGSFLATLAYAFLEFLLSKTELDWQVEEPHEHQNS